ncbi:MAG: hypothetical protein AAB898_01650 [Patescibacteria group bacterium]
MREGGPSFSDAHHVGREEELASLQTAREKHRAPDLLQMDDHRDEWQVVYPPDHLFARLPTQQVRTLNQEESKRVLAAEEKTEALDVEKFEAQGATQSVKREPHKVKATVILDRGDSSWTESEVDLQGTHILPARTEKKELAVTPVMDLRGVRIGGQVVRSSEKIGEGGFGVAYRVTMEHDDPTMERTWGQMGRGEVSGGVRVLKIIEEPDLDTKKSDMVVREVEAARTDSMHLLLDGRRLVTSDGGSYIALLMELAPGESLKNAGEILDEGTEEEAHEQRFALAVGLRALVDQLRELHEEGWLHLDIKPDNIRFDETFPHMSRLIDVGIARKKGEHASRDGTIEGSPPYILPDALSLAWASATHPEFRDIYALGLSFGETLGIMKIKKAENIFVQFAMASEGRLIESHDPTDRSGVSPDISEPTLSLWTMAELRLAKLVQAMVRPNDTIEERAVAYGAWDEGRGMTMEGIAREIDEIVEQMQGEREHVVMTKEEINELRQSVFEASIREAHASWTDAVRAWKMHVDASSIQKPVLRELQGRLKALRTQMKEAAIQDDYDLVTILARDIMNEIQAHQREPEALQAA